MPLIHHRITSVVLFVLMHRVKEPFGCHLLGTIKAQSLLPLILPYKTSTQRAIFSEMSFKCRSSTSLSSDTLVPSFRDSTTALLPAHPEKVVGLGIYASKISKTSFLAPRPSLSSIQSHATSAPLPPSSPVPPLPAYFPEKYRTGSAMHKAVYPPRRPPRPERSKSERTVRIVPPSPALSIANLEAYNKSVESLSSVYSRSISGEKDSHKPSQRPGFLTDGSRTYSSSSTATVKKSSLGAMRLAEDPDVVVVAEERLRQSSEGSDSEIDDATTLQAKLPSVKAVSDFGDVQNWTSRGTQQSQQKEEGRHTRRQGFAALTIRKTRDSASIFQSHAIEAIA